MKKFFYMYILKYLTHIYSIGYNSHVLYGGIETITNNRGL